MAPLERAGWCPPGAPGEEETPYPMGLGQQVQWFSGEAWPRDREMLWGHCHLKNSALRRAENHRERLGTPALPHPYLC